jgi:cytochrome c-type biogenesis protein CcmH/NrfF
MHSSVPSRVMLDSPLAPLGKRVASVVSRVRGSFHTFAAPAEGVCRNFRPQSTTAESEGARPPIRLALITVAAILVLFQASPLGAQPKTTLEKVGSQVYCQCGCVTTLNHCPHLPSQCESRAEMTAVILKDIQQGKDEPAILQDLAARYGVKVLAAPPAKGFDLAVWVLPGFGLVMGLIAVVLIVRHLRKKSAPLQPTDEVSIDAQTMAAVEEEMERTVPSVITDK